MFLTKTRKSGGRGAGGGVGTACRAGLRPRGMGGGLECWVKHGVVSRCGPYKQSERPRAAKNIYLCRRVQRRIVQAMPETSTDVEEGKEEVEETGASRMADGEGIGQVGRTMAA